ncbi:MAG: thiopurine S-methyltransferase [Methylophaga sp.]|nr:MAG: thiopurine S-methyltransferase [Methylophaga sp.]
MDVDFWHQKWKNNEIGFHLSEVNSLLVKYIGELSLVKGNRIFVPLCGKTLDIAWLLSEGYCVVGAELSEDAIKQLFEKLDIEPQVSKPAGMTLYSANGIDIFVGNIFDLSGENLGVVDAIYDRAALVALPEAIRTQYTLHVLKITLAAPQLLISYEYNQNLMSGPPFSVCNEEVKQHYKDHYSLALLENMNIPDGLKGKYAAQESVWLLK